MKKDKKNAQVFELGNLRTTEQTLDQANKEQIDEVQNEVAFQRSKMLLLFRLYVVFTLCIVPIDFFMASFGVNAAVLTGSTSVFIIAGYRLRKLYIACNEDYKSSVLIFNHTMQQNKESVHNNDATKKMKHHQ